MTALAYLILLTLSNLHSSIQDAPDPPSRLLQILQWYLRQVSLRQQHCRTSVFLRHFIQALSYSLVPEVEVKRTVTQFQSDKMQDRRCCRELDHSGEASTKPSACNEVLRVEFGAVHNLHSTVY